MLEGATAVDVRRQEFSFDRRSLEPIRQWIVSAVGGLGVLPATDLDPLGAAVCHTLNLALAPIAQNDRRLSIEVGRNEDVIEVRVEFLNANPQAGSNLILYRRGNPSSSSCTGAG